MADFSNLDGLLQDFVDEGIPGCACQIARKGETIYENYVGFSDTEKKIPITKNSLFRLASMSKIPLYTTCMILFEQGKFLLSDPIYNFLPEWKNIKKFVNTPTGEITAVPVEGPITIRDCLSMKCGMPYCHSKEPTHNQTVTEMQRHMQPLWDKGYYTNREHVKAMAQAPLAFEPGTRWQYGFSSELSAALIEAVCDKPIDDVFEELLFNPLGMDNTRSRYFGNAQQRMVNLCVIKDNGDFKPDFDAMDKKHLPGKENEAGWARLFSSVNDFTKLMQMLANGGVYNGVRVLGRKTIDLMRTNGLDANQQWDYDQFGGIFEAGYGYGYGVRTLIDKNKGNHNGSLGAFGWTGGFGTWCEADPSEGVSIVYMQNTFPDLQEYHLRVRAAAYGGLD